MSAAADSAGPQGLERLYREKARAEIAAAERLVPGADAVASVGEELAVLLVLKGEPGPGDRASRRAFGGDDGEAAARALDALGLPAERFFACTRVGADDAGPRIERLRALVEAVDPRVIVAADRLAAADLATAYGTTEPPVGELVRILGRDVVALEGLEASLPDPARKRRVWEQMQALRPVGRTGR